MVEAARLTLLQHVAKAADRLVGHGAALRRGLRAEEPVGVVVEAPVLPPELLVQLVITITPPCLTQVGFVLTS